MNLSAENQLNLDALVSNANALQKKVELVIDLVNDFKSDTTLCSNLKDLKEDLPYLQGYLQGALKACEELKDQACLVQMFSKFFANELEKLQ